MDKKRIHHQDAPYFVLATNEFDRNDIRDALWCQAIALAEGDEVRAKHLYVQLRASQIKDDVSNDTHESHLDRISKEVVWRTQETIISETPKEEPKCKKCYGKGWILRPGVKCPECTKRESTNVRRECPHCSGRGFTLRPGNTCKNCKGNGYQILLGGIITPSGPMPSQLSTETFDDESDYDDPGRSIYESYPYD
jgi:Zn finger protein HypA/HybF involved in hydrogenase expression